MTSLEYPLIAGSVLSAHNYFISLLCIISFQRKSRAQLKPSLQRFKPSDPLSTPLVTIPHSIDFATRIAKILAKKTGKPVYVGCSIAMHGVTVDQEVEGMKAVVQAVTQWLDGQAREKD